MAFTPTSETRGDDLPRPSFDLRMVAALGFLPLEVAGICAGDSAWPARVGIVVFVASICVDSISLRRRGRAVERAAFTGAWLAPLIAIVATLVTWPYFGTPIGEYFCFALGFSLLGMFGGLVTAKQFDALLVLVILNRRRRRRQAGRREPAGSLLERLDAFTTPLAAPPRIGLPRQFSIRGMLIITTIAALALGVLSIRAVEPRVEAVIIVFLAGALAAQVLLFDGRHPIKASMWAGAFLVPAETLVVNLCWPPGPKSGPVDNWVWVCMELPFSVLGGILLGAIAGAVGGLLYFVGDKLLLWLFRGLPRPALEPIAEADADVVLSWIYGPNLCRRWAGERLAWPLTREQLIARFAAAPEGAHRRIFKAVDLRTGNMFGYVELHIEPSAPRAARLEMAIVDTAASERGRRSVLLLELIVVHAFRDLNLAALFVADDAQQPEVASCFDNVCGRCPEVHAIRSHGKSAAAIRYRDALP